MTPESYIICLIIAACLLSYFGGYLVLGKIPKKLLDSAYHRARQFMGAAFILIAISIFIFYTTDMNNGLPRYRIALNLSFYYIVAKLIATSFITLIGEKVTLKIRPKRYKIKLAFIFIFPIVIWSTVLIDNMQALRIAQYTMTMIFLISLLLDINYFFRRYNNVIKIGDYYYAEGISMHIGWMIKSVYYIIGVGLLSSVMALFSHVIPKWILFIYMIYFTTVCIYIFNQYIRFISIYSELIEKEGSVGTLVPELDINKAKLSLDTYQYINQRIAEWIHNKEYCKRKVNIVSTASQISTNRLYLSSYINTTYKCSFKAWISKLRVTEAKKLMLENRRTTITSIAEQVGFVSLASFTHAFKTLEGVSPKEWQLNQPRRSSKY